MAAGAIFQANFIGHGSTGEQMITTMHFIQTIEDAPVDPSNVGVVATQIDLLVVPRLLLCCGTDYMYDRTRVVGEFGDAIGVAYDVTVYAGNPGAGSGLADTYERSVIIRKQTGVAGRGGRGRCFLPMPPANNFNPDGQLVLAGPDTGAFQDFAAHMILPFVLVGIGDFQACLFNRTTHTSALITGGSVGPLVGIQRRRRFGVGS